MRSRRQLRHDHVWFSIQYVLHVTGILIPLSAILGFQFVKLKSPGWPFYGRHMNWLTVIKEYLFHKWPRICSVFRNHNPVVPHSWLVTGFVTIVTRRVQLVQQELLTLPQHLSSSPFFTCLIEVRVLHIVNVHVFIYLVPCCDVCYNFWVKKIFG
jgi:hypothetical protein